MDDVASEYKNEHKLSHSECLAKTMKRHMIMVHQSHVKHAGDGFGETLGFLRKGDCWYVLYGQQNDPGDILPVADSIPADGANLIPYCDAVTMRSCKEGLDMAIEEIGRYVAFFRQIITAEGEPKVIEQSIKELQGTLSKIIEKVTGDKEPVPEALKESRRDLYKAFTLVSAILSKKNGVDAVKRLCQCIEKARYNIPASVFSAATTVPRIVGRSMHDLLHGRRPGHRALLRPQCLQHVHEGVLQQNQ